MTRTLLLSALALLLLACGPTYVIDDEPYYVEEAPMAAPAVAAPGEPAVGYWGPHPVPPAYGGGFDQTDGPHYRPYYPVHPELYAVHDGYYVFIGDPYFYGYDGRMTWFAGPHVMHYPWGDEICYIDGPHRHWHEGEVVYMDEYYVVEDGYWVYVGFWPHWYVPHRHVYLHHYWPGRYRDHYHSRTGVARRAVERHPPKHTHHGETRHRKKEPHSASVPGATPAQAGGHGGAHPRDPSILPAHDPHRKPPRKGAAEVKPGVYRSNPSKPARVPKRAGAGAHRLDPDIPRATNPARAHPGRGGVRDDARGPKRGTIQPAGKGRGGGGKARASSGGRELDPSIPKAYSGARGSGGRSPKASTSRGNPSGRKPSYGTTRSGSSGRKPKASTSKGGSSGRKSSYGNTRGGSSGSSSKGSTSRSGSSGRKSSSGSSSKSKSKSKSSRSKSSYKSKGSSSSGSGRSSGSSRSRGSSSRSKNRR
jgi:hypothetical protein